MISLLPRRRLRWRVYILSLLLLCRGRGGVRRWPKANVSTMISLLKPKRGPGCGSKASHGETHSDETVIRRVARRLGRSWCFTAFPSAGASGGIALLWNASFVKTQVLSIHSHYFNAAVRFMNSDPWILTGGYARVSITNRNLLWNSLGAI
ncbi:unnamed protein product, partial [Musa acuminata subsp. burmannicoides]